MTNLFSTQEICLLDDLGELVHVKRNQDEGNGDGGRDSNCPKLALRGRYSAGIGAWTYKDSHTLDRLATMFPVTPRPLEMRQYPGQRS
jgi:hypothetical protein